MTRKGKQQYMMIALEQATDLYLFTLATEGKSPNYISCLRFDSGCC